MLPLARDPLVGSGLVIGSMSPDIPYYLPVLVDAQATHSAMGVVSVDVLLGLGVFVLWHGLLARPALASVPAGLRGRIPAQTIQGLRARLSPTRSLLLILLSLSVGAATHVLWDVFTHSGRWGVTHIPWLAGQHGLLPGYRWAQYGSGLLGALVIAMWLARWWRGTAVALSAPGLRPAVAARAWLAVFVAGAVGAAFGSVGPLTLPKGPDLRGAAFFAATRGITLAVLVALLLAASWHLATRRQPMR